MSVGSLSLLACLLHVVEVAVPEEPGQVELVLMKWHFEMSGDVMKSN
jgi:hypothetical protein